MFKISRFLLACALTAGYLLASPALAQSFDPSTIPDKKASNAYSQFGQHTGTDIIQFDGHRYQLMTWDDAGSGRVYRSLSIDGAAPLASNILFIVPPVSGMTLSDPDVVMAVSTITTPARLYANVVYVGSIGSISRTYYDAYVLTGSGTTATFARVTSFNPIALGATTFGSVANHIHSSPNIDANAIGQVAIAWQETYTDRGFVTTIFPSFTQTSLVRSVFAEVYAVAGHISGYLVNQCNGARGSRILAYNQQQTPNVLYNASTKPDVAMSNAGKISIVFVNSFAYTEDVPAEGTGPTDPNYVPATTRVRNQFNLVVNQYSDLCNYLEPTPSYISEPGDDDDVQGEHINLGDWGQNGLVNPPGEYPVDNVLGAVSHHEWNDIEGAGNGGASDGTPRIAAPNTSDPARDGDVEIVMDWTAAGCPAAIGPVRWREIRNWGKSYNPATTTSTFRPSYTTVSPPYVSNVTTTPTYLPVVAYYNTDYNLTCPYVVTWMAKSYPRNSDLFDIWGRTFIAGVPQSNDFGRINGLGTADLNGNQSVPSVAARYSDGSNVSYHLFNDESGRQQLSFKRLDYEPGGVGFVLPGGQRPVKRPAAPTGRAGTLQAYPNPFSNAVEFSLGLRPQEQVQQLVVTDMLGRVVEQVKVTAEQAGNQHLTWQPKQRLADGTYQVRLMTNQRSETLRLNKR